MNDKLTRTALGSHDPEPEAETEAEPRYRNPQARALARLAQAIEDGTAIVESVILERPPPDVIRYGYGYADHVARRSTEPDEIVLKLSVMPGVWR